MPRRLPAALTAVLLALAVVPLVASAAAEKRARVAAVPASHLYVAHVLLTGKAAKPRGERLGTGAVTICVDSAANTVSFGFDQLFVDGQPTAGHIHRGAVGTAGPVVFPFGPAGLIDPLVGEVQWAGTAKAAKSKISALVRSPKLYYVNVHTKRFPKGAIRGQLGPWKSVSAKDAGAVVCGTN